MGSRVGFGQIGAPINRQPVKVSGIAEETVASRYGRALLDLALDNDELDKVKESMELMKVTLNDVPELSNILSNPNIGPDKQKQLIDKIVSEGTPNQFCNYLVSKKRIEIIPQIIESFENLCQQRDEVETAEVISACEMNEEELFGIAKQVQEAQGCKAVKIKPVVNPDLIGGFILRFGGKEVDMSIRGRLNELKAIGEKFDVKAA